MMNGNGTSRAPEGLIDALDRVWHDHPNLVAQFGLEVIKPEIEQHYGVWSVPVASGVQHGSGYDLTRALNTLQEEVEKIANVPVTMLLDH